MDTIVNLKTNQIKYYEDEKLLDCSKNYLEISEIPEIPYLTWFNECKQRAIEQNFNFILFKNDTYIANNYIKQNKSTKQPPVIATIELIKSLHLKKDFSYLNINAGGNKTRVMPFYEALKKVRLLQFYKQLILDFDKPIYTLNLTTIDSAIYSRSRYKFDYLDFIHFDYDVILGAVKPNQFKQVREKAINKCTKYLILYTTTIEKVNCNYIYPVQDNHCFYVWDKFNMGKPTLKRTIKYNKISELDYIELHRINQ